MNILAICFQASPSRGSEFSVGWGWLSAIARNNELWVITNDSCREDIETYKKDHPDVAKINFSYVSWNTSGVGSSLWPVLRRIRYSRWRKDALVEALRISSTEKIDICHFVNAVGFLDVVPLWKTGRPFVWGPVGGLSFVSRHLFSLLPFRSRLFYGFKNVLRYIAIRIAPIPRRAASQASVVIAATAQTQSAMNRYWGTRSILIPEVGRPEQRQIARPESRRTDEPIRIAWSGRMHSGKAPSLILDAVGMLDSSVDWELHMIGDGPDREQLESVAGSRGLAERCQFHGWLSRTDAIATMEGAHVFVLTSIYDLTSNVLLEALTSGLPVICLSTQAAAKIVGSDCGVVVKVDDAGRIPTAISNAIKGLYEDESRRMSMAESALARSEAFTWESKMRALEEIYLSVKADTVPKDG